MPESAKPGDLARDEVKESKKAQILDARVRNLWVNSKCDGKQSDGFTQGRMGLIHSPRLFWSPCGEWMRWRRRTSEGLLEGQGAAMVGEKEKYGTGTFSKSSFPGFP